VLRRPLLPAALALAAVAAAAPEAAACRCAQRTLESYWREAEIIVVGKAVRVERDEAGGVERLLVDVAPRFGGGEPFKGTLDGVRLVTPASSAACGVAVSPGELYVIFAVRRPGEPALAWFDTCSGSRLYAGGPRAAEMEPFLGLPRNRIVARLTELAAEERDAAIAGPPAPGFHTSPACWSEPRIHHVGRPEEELRDRVSLDWRRAPLHEAEPVVAPNGAYRFWQRPPAAASGDGGEAVLLVDVERPDLLWIRLRGARGMARAEWVSEKLLFVRAAWGRIAFSDLLVDVERGVVVYEEAARDGTIAFGQYREACAGQCPCLAVPGSRQELAAAPPSRPAPGEPAGWEATLTGGLAHLDADWDGRVFSAPEGTVFTRSALHDEPRNEHPVDLVEVRHTASGPWLHVRIYDTGPCLEPRAVPVHAGWMPAFSASGRLIAGISPGGC
jgi:hypothetical protein